MSILSLKFSPSVVPFKNTDLFLQHDATFKWVKVDPAKAPNSSSRDFPDEHKNAFPDIRYAVVFQLTTRQSSKCHFGLNSKSQSGSWIGWNGLPNNAASEDFWTCTTVIAFWLEVAAPNTSMCALYCQPPSLSAVQIENPSKQHVPHNTWSNI